MPTSSDNNFTLRTSSQQIFSQDNNIKRAQINGQIDINNK